MESPFAAAINEGTGPRAVAAKIVADIAELDREIAGARTQREAKRLRQKRRLLSEMLAWCKTRNGY